MFFFHLPWTNLSPDYYHAELIRPTQSFSKLVFRISNLFTLLECFNRFRTEPVCFYYPLTHVLSKFEDKSSCREKTRRRERARRKVWKTTVKYWRPTKRLPVFGEPRLACFFLSPFFYTGSKQECSTYLRSLHFSHNCLKFRYHYLHLIITCQTILGPSVSIRTLTFHQIGELMKHWSPP